MFYYISDIHTEHKINFESLPEVMPEEEFAKIIAGIVDEVFASTMPHNDDDYLFIMGDTCESTHIGKLFYSRLVQLWKPDHSFVDSVELEPHSYFCSYFVTNDPAMDYPVEARSDDMYTIDVTPGSCKVVYLDVSGESFYEQITGKKRYYEAESTIETEDGFDTNATGQIGCYLTVPETFGDTVVVYVENLFTGAVKELDLYDSNNYSAYL